MIRLTVLYGKPLDPDAFMQYYEQTHLPLASRIPSLTDSTWGQCLPGPAGDESPYFLTAELRWDNPEAMSAALASPAGRAAASDLANFATGGVTMVVSEGH